MDIRQARQLAKDEITSPEILAQLATNEDYETRRNVAANPNTPTDTLLTICFEFPKEVINNSVIPLLLMENLLVFTCERKLHFIEIKKIAELTDREILRLGWTKKQAKNYLEQNYGKRSRLHLTNEECSDFLYRLRISPINSTLRIKENPNDELGEELPF